MKILLPFIMIILFGVESFSQSYYIIFASNLNSSGGVHREDASGADLYCVKFNSETKTVSNLIRLTTDTTSTEWFPSLSPDLKWIAYNHTKDNTHEIRIVNLSTKEITSIYSGGRYPEWIDNTRLLISNQKPGKRGIYQLDLDLSGTTPALLSEKAITDTIKCPGTSQQSDASPFPGYNKIVFHSIKSDAYVSAVSVINTDGTGFENLTNWEGVGHAIVNSIGDEIVYTSANNGIPMILKTATKTKSGLLLPRTGIDMAAYGNPFPGYPAVHWTYPAWGISDHSLIFSAQAANSSGDYEKSRIYLTNFDSMWRNAEITDISTLIETIAGKSGKEFCTASLREITGSGLPPIVYVNVVSHNVNYEDNSAYPNFLVDTTSFWKQRNDIVEFAKMCKEEGVKYNFETDWNFLMALDQYDKPMTNSNNKKLLKYLTEDLGFEVDACLHGSKYTYGDMGYLLNKQGITQDINVTVGGFIAAPPDSFLFDNFKNGIASKLEPGFVWYPKILHAPATYKHRNEDTIMFSGIWKPKSKAEFTAHDNNGPLICVGIYNGDVNGLTDLLVRQENGELSDGKMYTATIFQTQNSLNPESFRSTISSFSKYVSAGQMRWVGIKELADIWQNEYSSEPNQFLYDSNLPILQTDSASSVSNSGATLRGRCMPNNNNVTMGFEYGTTASLGSYITGSPANASGENLVNYSAALSSLNANTKYYYRAKVTGTFGTYYGLIFDFTTSTAQLTAPIQVSPNDNQSNVSTKPTFTWNAVTGASSYTLQISTSVGNWTNPLVSITGITQAGVTLANHLSVSTVYFWRVQALSGTLAGPWSNIRRFTTSSVLSVNDKERIPSEFILYQNYPNPFNPTTKIKFGLPKTGIVQLLLYDALGREVKKILNGELEAGYHEVEFTSTGLSSGIYFYRIKSGSFTSIRKMILLK